jgi:hypothetical protein
VKNTPFAYLMPILGLPAVFFIIIVTQISCIKSISV